MTVQPGTPLRVILHFTQPNQANALNISHVMFSGPNAESEGQVMSDIQNLFVGNFWWGWRTQVGSAVRLFTITVNEIALVNGVWEVVRKVGESLINTGGSVAQDLIDQRIAVLGRQPVNIARTEGKKYLIGLAEGAETGGVATAGALSAAASALFFITNPAQIGGSPGRVYVPGIASNTLGNFVQFIGDVLVPSITANQVRRKIGRGF